LRDLKTTGCGTQARSVFQQACQPEFSKNLETQHASQESQQKLMFASPGFTFVFFLTIHSTFMQFHACVPW